MAYGLIAKIYKWDLMRLQSFCKVKDTVKKTKQDWKMIFTNPTSDRGLTSNIFKEFKNLVSREPNSPIKKWGTELNKMFSVEED